MLGTHLKVLLLFRHAACELVAAHAGGAVLPGRRVMLNTTPPMSTCLSLNCTLMVCMSLCLCVYAALGLLTSDRTRFGEMQETI